MKTRFAALAIAPLLAWGPAHAEIVEIDFIADQLSVTPGTDQALGFMPDMVRGTITYDTDGLMVTPGQMAPGVVFDSATMQGVGFSVQIGDVSYDGTFGVNILETVDTVTMAQGAMPVDRWSVSGGPFNGSSLDIAALGSATIMAYDTEAMVFDDLTPDEHQLNDLRMRSLLLSLFDQNGAYEISSENVMFGMDVQPAAPVPLPASGLVALAGLAGMGAFTRRRRR